ncbi:MAG: hypothetical protein E6Q75_00835 [Rheinheimera sp.]|nr:MAG: hypothetical protein E6Q75_00835 [Rheinheimera sp.]
MYCPMPISELIVVIYHGIIPEHLTLSQWSQIVRVLRHQQCLARLNWRLQQLGIDIKSLPQFVQNHLKNAEIIANKQKHQVHYEAKELLRLLQPYTAKLLFLKGAGYSLANNASVGHGRTYSDIDLLVDKASLPDVEKELALNGFFAEDLDEYDQKYYRQWSHEIPPLRHGSRGTVLDVHHNLVPLISGRAPDINLFFAHTQTTELGYTIFKPAAMFLHSTVHLFLNEEIKHGFRDLTDLGLLIEQYQSEEFWRELVELAIQSNFARELCLALRYTNKILGQDIPASVQTLLLPYLPGKMALRYLDFIFVRVLRPTHPVFSDRKDQLAQFLLMTRGHYLKMPMPILLKHTFWKGYRNIATTLLGSNFWDKAEPDNNKDVVGRQ